MFYLINLIDFCKYALVLHSMAATHFKRVGKGQRKSGEAVEIEQ